MKLLKKEEAIIEFLSLKDPLDVLFIYPYRYDQNEVEDFLNWKIGDKVFFNGVLLNKPTTSYFGRRAMSRFQIEYQGNILSCTIYNRKWISSLNPGTNIVIEGKYNKLNNVVVSNYNTKALEESEGLLPVYRLSSKITILSYRNFIKKVYDAYSDSLIDDIPLSLQKRYRLLPLKTALKYIHFPSSMEEIKLAVRTLKYREFLLFNLSNKLLNADLIEDTKSPKDFVSEEVFRVANSLDFHLTKDQLSSLHEILQDLKSPSIMNRLLQGDVGSGKTIVAALAMYASILAKQQAAFMVPTEILAIQQYEYFRALFKPLNINVVCLFSSLKTFKKDYVLEAIKTGEADIVIGTHSLIQDSIEFNNLGLVVIDEQQRFGVNQRSSLFEKGLKTDRLLMSATPIPRTMASVLFSNMDVSTIHTKPKDRLEIITEVVPENSMKPILDKIINHVKQGTQIYIVCPAIEDNDESRLSDVNTIYESLTIELNQRRQLDFKLAKLHGQMDAKEKEEIMDDFSKHNYDILISTTVIEVGINVKNANVMIIYNADSFGLSQLHQLRGRVGRGSDQGYCYLLNGSKTPESKDKLDFMASTSDGFEISNYDLKMRGPGDVLGVRQSGLPNFILGDLEKDFIMLEYALKDAEEIMNDIDNDDYRAIIKNVQTSLKDSNLIES